jgi:CRISPR-associated protein Cas1
MSNASASESLPAYLPARMLNKFVYCPRLEKAFFRAYEQRMDTLVTHPMFGYRVSYRRMLEIQTRLLARVVTGELSTYPVFTTR